MCGIVGYVGYRTAQDVLLEGLHRLEYRGYDSAGIAVAQGGRIGVRKKAGRVQAVAASLEAAPLSGTVGIGHTRWATHGATTDVNSHPHVGGNGEVVLVHNGVIENHAVTPQSVAGAWATSFGRGPTPRPLPTSSPIISTNKRGSKGATSTSGPA